MMVFTRLLLAYTIMAALLLNGCKKDKYPPRFRVTGKVTFPDGAPVRTGVIEFVPIRGNLTANGTINSDGTYSLSTIGQDDGACAGEYRVIVKQFIFYDKIPKEKHDHGGDVSVTFADEGTTPLRLEVKEKNNEANFQVKYHNKG
ncbi:MAG: carboxypeptidase-like regulatory domain-containing protein [Pirellulales bacterium]|nr:carboxypeptidase-like regulatory domain-containing protein [Pirellulales bacterium]